MNQFSNTNNGFLLKNDYEPKKERKSVTEEVLSKKRRNLTDSLLGPKDTSGESREIKDQLGEE